MAQTQWGKFRPTLAAGGPAAHGDLFQDLQQHWGMSPDPQGEQGPVQQNKVVMGDSGAPGERKRVFQIDRPDYQPCVGGACASQASFNQPCCLVSDSNESSYACELDRQMNGGKRVPRTTFNYRAMNAT